MAVPSLEAFLKKKQGAKVKGTNFNKEPQEDKEVKKSLKVDEKERQSNSLNDRKFPSLAKAGSVLSATMLDATAHATSSKVETHKNKFDNLASDDEEVEGERRIGDAKKRGVLEASKVASKVEKADASEEAEPKQKSSREQFLDEEAAKVKVQKKAERDALKAQIKASLKGEVAPVKAAEVAAPVKVEIKADEFAIAAKYEGRRKLPRVDLPAEEIACC